MPVTESSKVLEDCKRQLMEYFNHQRRQFDVPMAMCGTEFQKAVWSAMQKIEYGTCVSYKKLAEMAGYPGAMRAAGTACGLNPIAIVVPCHRVIKSDGSTGNYAWGSEMKQILIDLEKGEVL
jgi:methylated-DNA-[protein]-cysteine S-methyltransferase